MEDPHCPVSQNSDFLKSDLRDGEERNVSESGGEREREREKEKEKDRPVKREKLNRLRGKLGFKGSSAFSFKWFLSFFFSKKGVLIAKLKLILFLFFDSIFFSHPKLSSLYHPLSYENTGPFDGLIKKEICYVITNLNTNLRFFISF